MGERVPHKGHALRYHYRTEVSCREANKGSDHQPEGRYVDQNLVSSSVAFTASFATSCAPYMISRSLVWES